MYFYLVTVWIVVDNVVFYFLGICCWIGILIHFFNQTIKLGEVKEYDKIISTFKVVLNNKMYKNKQLKMVEQAKERIQC